MTTEFDDSPSDPDHQTGNDPVPTEEDTKRSEGEPVETRRRSTERIVAPLDDGDERLDPKVVVYWMLSGVISTLVLGAVLGAAGFAFRKQLPGGAERWLTYGLPVLALLLIWQFVHAPLNHRRWRFRVDDRLLQVRWGVLVHEEKTIPMSRLQHVDLVRGPVERLFGLATLIVFTAGSEAATFRVPGLTPERAEGLRDRIVAARGADVL